MLWACLDMQTTIHTQKEALRHYLCGLKLATT